jgi:hypothetical protein
VEIGAPGLGVGTAPAEGPWSGAPVGLDSAVATVGDGTGPEDTSTVRPRPRTLRTVLVNCRRAVTISGLSCDSRRERGDCGSLKSIRRPLEIGSRSIALEITFGPAGEATRASAACSFVTVVPLEIVVTLKVWLTVKELPAMSNTLITIT